MKRIVFLALTVFLFSLSGCYMGIRNVGEVGVYYNPPYARDGILVYPDWIPVRDTDYKPYSSLYPFWF
jgi:hypothetical protein